MPYDFSFVEKALHKCADKRNWHDRASEKLEKEYLQPLEHHTQALSSTVIDTERFMYSAEQEFDEIMNTF